MPSKNRRRPHYTIWLLLSGIIVAAIALLVIEVGIVPAPSENSTSEAPDSVRGQWRPSEGLAWRVGITESAPTTTPMTERARNIAIIKQIWGDDWELGTRIAACESQLKANAKNTNNPDLSEDVGLFQINSIHGQPSHRMMDPVPNTQFAYILFRNNGTEPWESTRHCWSRSSDATLR